MRFQPKQFTYFLERLCYRVVARTRLRDLEEGGELHTVMSAVARELDDISFQMVNLQRIWDLDTAQGEDLDDRARDTNPEKLSRRLATKATVGLVFGRTGTSGLISIPAGSIAKVAGDGPKYATSAAGSIADASSSSAPITAVAVEAGDEGNVDAATIVQLDAVSGVETVTNPAAATGGQLRETDAEFRARIKLYLRSLSRGTPDALKFAVLNTSLETFGRIVTAEVIELPEPDLGQVIIYVDDGAGTIEVVDDNYSTPETVMASATGGELRLFLVNKPVVEGPAVTVELNAAPLTINTDFTLNYATGQITLTVALSPGDAVTAEYTWYEGLIAEAQKIIDGDPTDRTTYPGYRAAGVQVFVLPPEVLQQLITAGVVVETGYDVATVHGQVQNAIIRYVNNLGINGDVILTELIYATQSVPGVVDVEFSSPTSNVVIGEGELARAQLANINLT